MRIVDVKPLVLSVPQHPRPLRSSGRDAGRHWYPWQTRTIVRVETDKGLTGLGELPGEEAGFVEGVVRPQLLNEDPLNIERLVRKLYGVSGARFSGVEYAFWDLLGKALDERVCDLLGGFRERVPFSAYMFYALPSSDGSLAALASPEAMLDFYGPLIDECGFTTLKLKGGVFPPEVEIATIKAFYERYGSGYHLRLDPNTSWTKQVAIAAAKQLEPYSLEYMEDFTAPLEAVADLKRHTWLPTGTNMTVVRFDQIPEAVRLNAIDVILGDPHYWMGIWGFKKLAGICESFELGLSMHSGGELGVSLAAMIHLAASTPQLKYACDAHYHHLLDDVIKGGKMTYQGGYLSVPKGPGLGVELDPERVAKYQRFHEETRTLRLEYDEAYRDMDLGYKQYWVQSQFIGH